MWGGIGSNGSGPVNCCLHGIHAQEADTFAFSFSPSVSNPVSRNVDTHIHGGSSYSNKISLKTSSDIGEVCLFYDFKSSQVNNSDYLSRSLIITICLEKKFKRGYPNATYWHYNVYIWTVLHEHMGRVAPMDRILINALF